ncbi:non-homologous end-joining DNA ligase [Actinomadura sp. HBU206391]|uniref:non-homologous end-joining DNA ligase n=1 Tax=Actinomadura sp. HBU206391 TaxID=2731692 RepID=UPI00164EFCD9|nr:non-homologous end-joining DNA ligase [Actinomadura sp. HBU206391]MBC6459769.1 DNA polymerase LigD [Actinomadura sp. HBU206391]
MAVPMPGRVAPMLASPGELPGEDAARWGLELKWDGVRVISYISAEGVRATGRRGGEVAGNYPELSGLADLLPGRQAILDGEVVAFDRTGRPSFELLQRRMHVAHPDRHVIREVPIRYVVFDLLFLDGHVLYDLPYADRRELLQALELTAGPIEAPSHLHASDAEQVVELLAFTREQELEGLVAKRLDSPYRPGRRVDHWRKVKNFRTQEVVVGGWKPGKGRRAGGVGSLLLGVYDADRLCFVGHVGTGFTDRMLDEMTALLHPLETPTSPYDDDVPREFARGARWVRPRLVGEVAYASWTAERRLRAPSWRGLRDDRNPADVTREP